MSYVRDMHSISKKKFKQYIRVYFFLSSFKPSIFPRSIRYRASQQDSQAELKKEGAQFSSYQWQIQKKKLSKTSCV